MKKELTLADINFLPQERLITEKEIFKEFREHIALLKVETILHRNISATQENW
ncbi:MAG: hypothetical protein FWG64_03095 [Firmicutes bacterium]|nr:hypothetical protein [Bacillota bacterium]